MRYLVKRQERHIGGRTRVMASVREEVKDALESKADAKGESTSSYVADLVAAHVGMEP